MAEPMQDDEADDREPGDEDVDERPWVDPRTGMSWTVKAIPGPERREPAGSPVTLVFRGRGGRHWVGYCGEKRLLDMDDTDLILLFDCTAAAAS